MSEDEKKTEAHILEARIAGSLREREKSRTDEATSNVFDGDEALLLVGMERGALFTEEYNLRLRRKLVRLHNCCPSP